MAPNPKLSFAVCIQARLGSTRLPGKVLKDLGGKTMLERIIDQAKASSHVKTVVIATSDAAQDDPLAQFAQRKGYLVFRGPVDDIIQRLQGSLQKSSCEALIRVWGDCPFICPDVIDEMAQKMVAEDLDFIHNSDISKRTYPPGLDIEIYRQNLLHEMNQAVKEPKLREFPVEYIKTQKNLRYALFSHAQDFSKIHLTVDYAEDLKAAEKLYLELQKEEIPFRYPTLLKVLQKTDLGEQFSGAARNIEYQKFLSEQKSGKGF